jgi:lysophospholipase L1-like esterase
MINAEAEKNKILKRSTKKLSAVLSKVGRTWIAFAFFVTAIIFYAEGQAPVNFTYKSFGLEQEESNVLENAHHLDDFFESLYQQQTVNNQHISIVHIGDSHIQADYLTATVRRNFQGYFGNSGRGVIIPYQVAGTNEPANIITRSKTKWTSKRCVHTEDPLPVGISGITISSFEPGAAVEIYMNDLWLDQSFNLLTLFYKKDQNSFSFAVLDSSQSVLATINPDTDEGINHSKVILPSLVSAIVLKTVKTEQAEKHATIFGLSFENGKNGVLYHAIGVNGAKYVHYNAAAYFAQQTSVLTPDLIVISLGTNEAATYPSIDPNFYQQIDKLVTLLRNANPATKFLFVTPPDAYRKKNKHNPGISIVRQQIIQYAVENGFAFYDMYKVLGGDHSADSWKNAGLLRPDGVHFTKDGYEYQGNLLFNAFMKSYNLYVPLRHP